MSDKLKAKVKVVNKAHAAANELYVKLAPIFAKFVGQQIVKADGKLLAKVEKLLPTLPFGNSLSVIHKSSTYSLLYEIQAVEPLPPYCVYHTAAVYIGEIQGCVLTKICDAPNFRADYTEAEITGKRLKYDAARSAMEAAQGELWPFDVRSDD
jgi:hypothetical protein